MSSDGKMFLNLQEQNMEVAFNHVRGGLWQVLFCNYIPVITTIFFFFLPSLLMGFYSSVHGFSSSQFLTVDSLWQVLLAIF